MTVYRTCKGCVFGKGPCAERAKLKSALSGLGLTSIKFKCSWRRPEFASGEPVRACVTGYYDEDPVNEYVDGYVVRYAADGRVVVYVRPEHFKDVFETDEGPKSNGYFKLSSQHIKKREGVPASYCHDCHTLSDVAGHEEWCKRHPDAKPSMWALYGALA